MTRPETISPHEPTAGPLLLEELQLAFRNRGMPLEAMQYDLTPTGLHYLVAHWDVPRIDPESWQLTIRGQVHRRLKFSLDDIHAFPRTTIAVTLECAGNGRGWLTPRPVSLPWLGEAIGTAEWTGTPLAPILEQAEIHPDSVEAVFWGADRGVQGDEEQTYARSLSLADVLRPEVMFAYEMNGRPLEPQHGFPLRLLVPGW
ncbi:MAG: molybdopterin-dependent oxidoreductase [Acidimicrobiia bacterium]